MPMAVGKIGNILGHKENISNFHKIKVLQTTLIIMQ